MPNQRKDLPSELTQAQPGRGGGQKRPLSTLSPTLYTFDPGGLRVPRAEVPGITELHNCSSKFTNVLLWFKINQCLLVLPAN
jgi:hypothetical protein